MKSLFNILFFLSAISALAQESDYSIPIDSMNRGKQFIPTGIRVGADILGPVLNAIDDRIISYEFFIEADLSNFSVLFESGHMEFTEINDNVDYAMSGNFSRIGPDVNFLASDKQLNSFSFGLRYAWANFSETITGDVTEANWGAVPVSFDINNNKSYWIEMTTGVKVRLWQGLFTGYIFRFRFLRSGTVPDVPFSPYFVPGYGLAERNSTWGFRYYLMYRFQWSKKPVKVKKKN